MKKTLMAVMAILMVIALFSCSATSSTSNSSAASSSAGPASPASAAASSGVAAAPSDNTKETIGSLTDRFDHFSRASFKIAYICNDLSWAWNAAISDSLDKLGKVLNYDYQVLSTNGDADLYMNGILTLADQGVKGLIVGIDDSMAPRVYELCKEAKVAFIAESTPFRDADGKNSWLSVQQDQYNNGATVTQWLIDHYKDYWKDPIDPAKLGMLVLNYSVVIGINEREPGCKDTFLKAFPEAKDNYFVGDLVTKGLAGFSAQGGNEETAAVLSAHPEIEKWFVVGLVDDWAQGAARAVEAMNKTSDVLVSSDQADAFLKEMETGNSSSCYVSACAVSSTEFAINLASALVTIIEGRATAETLWPEWRDNGYATMKIQGIMITKDTYQEWSKNHTVDAMVAMAKRS